MIRVVHFLGSMRPGHDGVTRVAYRMRDLLKNTNGKHSFVSPLVPSTPPPDMREVVSVPFPLHPEYRLSVCSSRSLRRILEKNQPDVVHIHSPCSLGFAAIKASHSLGIPLVATYHTHFPSYLRYYRMQYLKPMIWSYMRSVYNRCEEVIVPSTATLRDLKEHGVQNLVHIPHGVDTDLFSPSHRSQNWRSKVGVKRSDKNKKIVTFVGRLVWEKNLRVLANAAQAVRNSDKIQFVVIGDGPARESLEKMMPNAVFTGYLGEKDLPVAYASSDIFVFPSVTETFGNVTVEAMASGLPVICAAAGGAEDLVKPDFNGLLFSGNDSTEFANVIDYLAVNSELQKKLSEGALKTAGEYQWKKSINRYLRIYSRLAGQRRPHTKPVSSQFKRFVRTAFPGAVDLFQ